MIRRLSSTARRLCDSLASSPAYFASFPCSARGEGVIEFLRPLWSLSGGVAVQQSNCIQLGQARRHVLSKTDEYAYDDEGQARNRLKFVSRERKLVPRPPFIRSPIYFPTTILQMMKLTEEQRNQIKETGWTREVAFKTSSNVTKLEIKALLESMYGMQVERVHTANYLGRKYTTFSPGKSAKKLLWRADDWKKAYVIFRPPPGVQIEPAQQEGIGMLEQLLAAKGLGSKKIRKVEEPESAP